MPTRRTPRGSESCHARNSVNGGAKLTRSACVEPLNTADVLSPSVEPCLFLSQSGQPLCKKQGQSSQALSSSSSLHRSACVMPPTPQHDNLGGGGYVPPTPRMEHFDSELSFPCPGSAEPSPPGSPFSSRFGSPRSVHSNRDLGLDISAIGSEEASMGRPQHSSNSISNLTSNNTSKCIERSVSHDTGLVMASGSAVVVASMFYCAMCMTDAESSRKAVLSGSGGCDHQICCLCMENYLSARISLGHTMHPCPFECTASVAMEEVKRCVCKALWTEQLTHYRNAIGKVPPCAQCGHVDQASAAASGAYGSGNGSGGIGASVRRSITPASPRPCVRCKHSPTRRTGAGVSSGLSVKTPSPRGPHSPQLQLGRKTGRQAKGAASTDSGRGGGGGACRGQKQCASCKDGVLQPRGHCNLVECKACSTVYCYLCRTALHDDNVIKHFRWYSAVIGGCPHAMIVDPSLWEGEYLGLYKSFLAIFTVIGFPITAVVHLLFVPFVPFVLCIASAKTKTLQKSLPAALIQRDVDAVLQAALGGLRVVPNFMSVLLVCLLIFTATAAWLPVGLLFASFARCCLGHKGRRTVMLSLAPLYFAFVWLRLRVLHPSMSCTSSRGGLTSPRGRQRGFSRTGLKGTEADRDKKHCDSSVTPIDSPSGPLPGASRANEAVEIEARGPHLVKVENLPADLEAGG